MNLVTVSTSLGVVTMVTHVKGGWLSAMCVAEGLVRMCCSSLPATSLELGQHRAFVFYLGLCMFSCIITGTWCKSNGPNTVWRNPCLRSIKVQ